MKADNDIVLFHVFTAGRAGMRMSTEIGRELKVSELIPLHVVVLQKDGMASIAMTLWVQQISEQWVRLYSGVTGTVFLAARSGPDLEELIDDAGARVRIYEYLGAI
jgi:hypothetical protein